MSQPLTHQMPAATLNPAMRRKMSPDVAKCPWGWSGSLPVENHWSNVNYKLLNVKGRGLYN